MIKIRPATIEDIDAAMQNPLPVFGDVDHKPGALHCLEYGQLYALVDEENNLCGVMGGFLFWGGVASISSVLTPHLLKHPVTAIRVTRRLIGMVEEALGLHRMEMAVDADYTTGHRWAKALGFEAEGLMKKYSADKRDHVMYGRTK